MLSSSTKTTLGVALADDVIANQIDLRLVSSTPASVSAAQALLQAMKYDPYTVLSIQDALVTALAGDDRGAAGLEMAAKINGAVNVLQAYVNADIAPVAAQASLATTTPIVLTSVAKGTARNTNTLTLHVNAAAANPTNTILAAFAGSAAAITLTITPNDGTNTGHVASATLATTAPVVISTTTHGSARNGNTFTLVVNAAAANPTNTILAQTSGTSAATVLTITPNDGTNNSATPVNLTTANLAELIATGTVAGKTVTVTDSGSLLSGLTATGGDATNLAHSGEGDGDIGTFSGGVNNVAIGLTTAQVAALINAGTVAGKSVTVTDASSRRILQTATGGDATAIAHSGEGDGDIGTFSGGSNASDVSLVPAQEAMGSDHMSKQTYLNLIDAMGDEDSAAEVQSAFNLMIDSIQAIIPT